VALFGFLGNLRYWGEFDIAEYVGIDSRLSSLVWAYIYVATPYDLAVIAMRETDPVGLPLAFMGPPLKLLQMDAALESLGGEPQEFAVRGINSVGGLALFIHDYGMWFWIEWALFGVMIGYLWHWAEKRRQLGAAGMVLAMVFLLFFDSAILRPQIVGAIVLATIIGREEQTQPNGA
jgi:hypothetical protein